MATATVFGRKRLLLRDVDWRTYCHFLRIFQNRPGVRLTYDQGKLEIMTLSHRHESYGEFLGSLVFALVDEMGLTIKQGGSNTLRRRRFLRGLEPDKCYWIVNEPLVRGKEEIDLRTDPPPDLAIEIDITHSSLNRMGIYAALRIPEVWRFDGLSLTFHILGNDGKYQQKSSSRLFPFLKSDDLVRFLQGKLTRAENLVVREFRAWVRQQLAAPGGQQP